MGQSTDALLAFGVCLAQEGGELDFLAHASCDDLDDMIRAEAGISDGEYGEVWKAAKAAYPVDLIQHCSGDYPMWILAVRGTNLLARRGYPEDFDPAKLTVTQDQIEALKAFVEKHAIELADGEFKPSWLLFSNWN